jgi:hypothetical protein
MGDRCNVYITGAEVFLYSHWGGDSIAITVRDALKRGKERWSDGQYLPRIVFCEMIRGDIDGLIGFGIANAIWDNGRPIIVLDTTTMKASVTRGSHDKADVAKTHKSIPFAKLVEMSDDEVRVWHLGKDAE